MRLEHASEGEEREGEEESKRREETETIKIEGE